ncbi:MAG: hypothetical protein ACE1ZB_05335, partial [Gammaproteobacteria bacterium]
VYEKSDHNCLGIWQYRPANDEFVLEVPATFDSKLSLRGVLEITPEGSISAYFEQTSSTE